ncbi:MAG: hypothetical protein IPJ03_17935 [Ignavibacteriales bacterium]|nr:hypothetical protein [Ignavibacteriales bacterium]
MNELEKLISFLERTGARIEYRERWMVKDNLSKEWVVYQRKFRAKKTNELSRTENLEFALIVLEYQDKL